MADPVVQVADQAYYGLESRLAPQLICPNVGSFVTSMWPRTSWLVSRKTCGLDVLEGFIVVFDSEDPNVWKIEKGIS